MTRFCALLLLASAALPTSLAAVVWSGEGSLRVQQKNEAQVHALVPVPQDCCPDVCADIAAQRTSPGHRSKQPHKVLSDCLAERKRHNNGTDGSVSLKSEGAKCYRNPTVWGPPTWFFLHSMTLALDDDVPADQQAHIKSLMNDLTAVLPCPSCGVNLAKHMKEHPIDMHLTKRKDMVKWMVDIHNMVNKDVGNREVSQDEALKGYKKAFAKDSDKKYLEVLPHRPATRGPWWRRASLSGESESSTSDAGVVGHSVSAPIAKLSAVALAVVAVTAGLF